MVFLALSFPEKSAGLLAAVRALLAFCLPPTRAVSFVLTSPHRTFAGGSGPPRGSTRDRFQIRGWSGTLIPKHYMIVEDPNLNGARCPTPSCATPGQASRRLTSHSRANGLVPASSKGCHGT